MAVDERVFNCFAYDVFYKYCFLKQNSFVLQPEASNLSTVYKSVTATVFNQILTEISQTWANMEFCYEEHHRTRTPLLKSDEQLFEALENNQVRLWCINITSTCVLIIPDAFLIV